MVSEPLWRSERCKRKASSIYQASKAETSSESLPSHVMKRKKDMTWENSSKQSTSGTVEACEGEEDEITSPEIKIIRMRVHAYKALFQKQEKKVKVSGPFQSPPTLEEDLDNSTDGRNEARRLYDPQRRLHQSLQHKISRICEVLNLGDKVNNMTEEFLDYVINNHLVTQEPSTILQAFQLALCWTAASILKVKVDHKESLQLVQTHMSYGCKKEEADIVYTMLCGLKKTFLERRSNDIEDVEDSLSRKEDVKEAISNAIKKIKKEYGKQMEKLMQQQKKEIDEVQKAYEAEKAKLDNKRQVEAAIIRLQYREGPTRTDKLNTLEGDMAGKIEESKNQMTAHLNKLDRTHHASRTKLHLKEFSRIISMKEWAQTKLLDGENAQTSGGANGQVDQVTPLPNREGVCPHSKTENAVFQIVQHLQSQIPDRTIADETANVVSRNVEPLQNQNPDTTIADDFTSVVEQDISDTPNDQASHPNEFGDSTPVQPLVTCASAPVTVFPEEPHDQPNGSCTLRTTQGETASLIEQLNACALVSSNSDATPPDQHDSAELTPSVQDLSRVDTAAAYLSLEGHNSMSSPATRPFEEVLEPQMNSVSGQWTGPPGFENTLLSSFPLQTEIEKINKEEGCRMRDHENLKMELNLECQKEIEHSVSQIHLKYKTKNQEAEELHKNKTKELAVSRHQVYMSKILAAAAFRLKYMDFSTTVARSLPDLFSEFELPQSNQASFPPAPPSTLQTPTALSSAMTSTMQLSVQGLSAQQQLRHNAPIPASTPRPSPVISQFTAPVNVQVCGNKRGPATHLQPNRPRPLLSPSPASLPPRGTYQPVNLPPSTSSHRTVSVSPGAVELLRGQLNPTPQMNIMGKPPEGSSSSIVEIRNRRGNGAAAIQIDSSQIVCLSDDDDDK